ncbi:MAG TPA: tetratricopeptide repeat protein [Steroidobacteraceae bacterium]
MAASQRKIWFTYNGGRVFDLRPTEHAPQQTEGAAFAERKEFGQAMADLNRAVELAPYDAENFHQRGLVCWQSGNVSQAASDFDQALKLKPDDVPTLVDRGALLLKGKAEASAQADFERAEQLAPKDAALSLRIAEIYEATARYREAATQLDRWVSDNPRDDRVAGVLGARCFARALTGDEPQRALSDCNTALRNGWRTSQVYESRGLLYLRARNFAKAMSDFNESLRLRANDPEALYGLGLAKNSAGQREAGERDMQAAVALRDGNDALLISTDSGEILQVESGVFA